MGRRRLPHERKLRTREHVLADLSVNHVERQILLRGFAVNRLTTDYGIDLMMLSYNAEGEVENGHVLFQIKGTDHLHLLQDKSSLSIRVDVADLKAWQDEPMPVILAVYDGQRNRAHWLNVQQYLEERNVSSEDMAPHQDRVTLRVPLKNRLNVRAVETFRRFRKERLEQGGFRGS